MATQGEKDLLLKYPCTALPYGVMVKAIGWDVEKNKDVEVNVLVYSVNTEGHVEFGTTEFFLPQQRRLSIYSPDILISVD